MIFYSIKKEKDVQYKINKEILQEHRGIKFSNDHQSLVVWSTKKRNRTRIQEILGVEHVVSLRVYRVDEVNS